MVRHITSYWMILPYCCSGWQLALISSMRLAANPGRTKKLREVWTGWWGQWVHEIIRYWPGLQPLLFSLCRQSVFFFFCYQVWRCMSVIHDEHCDSVHFLNIKKKQKHKGWIFIFLFIKTFEKQFILYVHVIRSCIPWESVLQYCTVQYYWFLYDNLLSLSDVPCL